jgi:NADPH:quinone reductase-like Zn-dependent oxidoreductase
MKQIWIPKIGGPEVLELREAPDPEPAAGEIRLRVRASGINFADILARMGLYKDSPPRPCVVGYEVAGYVDGIGDGVEGVAEGDRMVTATRFGGYSDVVCVPAAQARPIPAALDFEDAASIPVNWLTSWWMLVRLANLQRGETVLVHACAGGVGLASLQICHHHGATVIGTASASKHDRLRQMGVAHCIDYRTQDFEQEVKRLTDGRGVDVVLDAVGGKSFAKSYRVLADLGRLVAFGASSFAPGKRRNLAAAVRQLVATPRYHPFDLMLKNRGVFGFNLGRLWHRGEESAEMMGTILDLVADGSFETVVDRAFPFERAGEAHRYIQDRKNFGKVVLVP